MLFSSAHVQSSAATTHLLPGSLRAAIIAASCFLLSLSLTNSAGSSAAAVGVLVGVLSCESALQRRPLQLLRTPVIVLLLGGVLLLGVTFSGLLSSASFASALFGPIGAFNAGEMLKWFTLTLTATWLLRTLARRTNYGAILEILFVAVAFVLTLAAHRNGMINRPFLLGDFAITRGIDPSTVLLAFGAGAVLALSALLMIEQNQRRLPYHFLVLGLLCCSLIAFVRLFGLPSPQLTNDLGLTGQSANGNSSANENPFRDGENNTDDKEAPVAVVVFRDDYEPLNGSYYFRESAYSQFNGTMLDFSSRPDMDRDLIGHFTSDRAEAEVLPEANNQRTQVRTSVGMLVPHRAPFGLVSPIVYENKPNPNNLRFKRTYESISLAPEYDFEFMLGRELGREDWSEDVWQEYLRLPDDPRYGELAQQLIAGLRPQYADDPFAKAWAIKTYLDENGIYSLRNEHAYETDPAASFLFGDLTGYCMHFAFAATYMYRSLGIPARVGIGYSVPATNRAGGSALLVQAIHGHAWPEIYFRGVGWVIVDPAPQQTLVDMSTDPQNELQQLLGDMLRDEAAFEEFLESQQSSLINLALLRQAVVSLLLLVVISAYLTKLYRYWLPGHGTANKQYRTCYRAALDAFAAIGKSRRAGESRESFAMRMGSLSPTMQRLTAAHLAAALGGMQQAQYTQAEWQDMTRHVRKDIQSHVPAWKRLLGFLNPFSWLFSR